MSAEKLERLVSERVDAPVDRVVHVRWGYPLSFAGGAVAFVILLILAMVFRAPFLAGAPMLAVLWWMRGRKVFGEAVLASQGDDVIVVETFMSQRNPLREIHRQYPSGTQASFRPSTRWWRAPVIAVGDDEWFVIPRHKALAEESYA